MLAIFPDRREQQFFWNLEARKRGTASCNLSHGIAVLTAAPSPSLYFESRANVHPASAVMYTFLKLVRLLSVLGHAFSIHVRESTVEGLILVNAINRTLV